METCRAAPEVIIDWTAATICSASCAVRFHGGLFDTFSCPLCASTVAFTPQQCTDTTGLRSGTYASGVPPTTGPISMNPVSNHLAGSCGSVKPTIDEPASS